MLEQFMKNGLSAMNGVNIPRIDQTDRKIIGELTADGVVLVMDTAGRPVEVRERGYDHFA